MTQVNANEGEQETAEQKARRFMDDDVERYLRQYVNYLHASAPHPAPLREIMVMRLAEMVRGGEDKARAEEVVNHPSHYTSHPSGVECVEIAEHLSFNLGNALKYVWRAGLKGEGTRLEDVKKALWYIEREAKAYETYGTHEVAQNGAGGKLAMSLARKVIEARPVSLSTLFLESLLRSQPKESFREISALLKLSIACLESPTGKDAQARLSELLELGLNAREERRG